MENIKQKWIEALGSPSYEIPKEPIQLVKKYEYEDLAQIARKLNCSLAEAAELIRED